MRSVPLPSILLSISTCAVLAATATAQLATSTATGQSCVGGAPLALHWGPNPAGGYDVSPGGAFDYQAVHLGQQLSCAGGGVHNVFLGFPFRFPDGTWVHDLAVDSNGRVFQTGMGLSDFTPTEFEHRTQAGGQIAALWGDWSAAPGGHCSFHTNGLDYAAITWYQNTQFGAFDPPMSFQLQIIAPLTFVLCYEVGYLDNSTHTFIVGASDGTGLGSEVDLSTHPFLTPGSTYEVFQNDWDLQVWSGPLPLGLSAVNNPVIGSNWQLALDRIPGGASSVAMMIGFSNVQLPLFAPPLPFADAYGCFLYSDNALPAASLSGWAAGDVTATFSLPISGFPGLPIVLQAAVVDFGANSLNIVTSNAVEGVTGL